MYIIGLEVNITKGAHRGKTAKIISVSRQGDYCTVKIPEKDGFRTLSHMTWNEMKKK